MRLMGRSLGAVLILSGLAAGCVSANLAPSTGPGVTVAPLPGATSGASPRLEPSAPEPSSLSPVASSVTGTGVASPVATIVVPRSTPIASPVRTPRPTALGTPSPTVAPLGFAELRYRLVDQLGRPLFCDPDSYPVARADEAALAQERLPEIRGDGATYGLILGHLELGPATVPNADQVLAIYREWKMLRALVLQPVAGVFRFDYVAASAAGAQVGWHVAGTIDAAATISLVRRDPSGPPPCPICLARGTMISTPGGSIAVEDLRIGATVWTADPSGNPIRGRVLLIGSTPVPPTHRVVHLVLADGRTLEASPRHPLTDGRLLGDLRVGDEVDGSQVASAELAPYAGGMTFDLLPAGPTGAYWADGILLGSTLRPSR